MTIPTKKLTNGFEMPVYGFGTWQMDVEDIERLRKEYPNQKNVSDVVPLG